MYPVKLKIGMLYHINNTLKHHFLDICQCAFKVWNNQLLLLGYKANLLHCRDTFKTLLITKIVNVQKLLTIIAKCSILVIAGFMNLFATINNCNIRNVSPEDRAALTLGNFAKILCDPKLNWKAYWDILKSLTNRKWWFCFQL